MVIIPRSSMNWVKAAQRPALQLLPRRAAQDSIKMPTISRAEGGQLQALVGPSCTQF